MSVLYRSSGGGKAAENGVKAARVRAIPKAVGTIL